MAQRRGHVGFDAMGAIRSSARYRITGPPTIRALGIESRFGRLSRVPPVIPLRRLALARKHSRCLLRRYVRFAR